MYTSVSDSSTRSELTIENNARGRLLLEFWPHTLLASLCSVT